MSSLGTHYYQVKSKEDLDWLKKRYPGSEGWSFSIFFGSKAFVRIKNNKIAGWNDNTGMYESDGLVEKKIIRFDSYLKQAELL